MKKTLFLLPLLFVISGCANPYRDFYTDRTGGMDALENPQVIVPTGIPNVVQGSNVESDGIQMLENCYFFLGESNFNAGPIKQNLAIEHAKNVHAETFILYSKHTETLSGSMPLLLPNTQTSYHSGSI